MPGAQQHQHALFHCIVSLLCVRLDANDILRLCGLNGLIQCSGILTYGVIMTCGDRDLGQHWFRQCLVACLMAPSHCLAQCWLITREVFRHSPEGKFVGNSSNIYPWHVFNNYWLKITVASSRGQCVDMVLCLERQWKVLLWSSSWNG